MLSPSRVAVVLASVALLVLGLDYATVAATGQGLVLGHGNRAHATTTVTNTGAGPALRLGRSHDGPALAVDSDAKIRHLNADEVDGMSAARLGSHAVTFTAGKRGATIHGTRIWDTPVKPGAYQVSLQAVSFLNDVDPQTPVTGVCGVVDVLTLGSNTRIYLADSDLFVSNFPAFMSGAAVVRVRPGQRPGLVCTTSANDADFTLFSKVKASFTRLTSRDLKRAHVAVLPGRASLRPFGS